MLKIREGSERGDNGEKELLKNFTTDRQKTRFVGFKFYMIEFQFLIKQIFSF